MKDMSKFSRYRVVLLGVLVVFYVLGIGYSFDFVKGETIQEYPVKGPQELSGDEINKLKEKFRIMMMRNV